MRHVEISNTAAVPPSFFCRDYGGTECPCSVVPFRLSTKYNLERLKPDSLLGLPELKKHLQEDQNTYLCFFHSLQLGNDAVPNLLRHSNATEKYRKSRKLDILSNCMVNIMKRRNQVTQWSKRCSQSLLIALFICTSKAGLKREI